MVASQQQIGNNTTSTYCIVVVSFNKEVKVIFNIYSLMYEESTSYPNIVTPKGHIITIFVVYLTKHSSNSSRRSSN